ncbi:unnamed protein product [Zymoseptoria tritici ST99CH_1A5]|uniref:DUF1754-domain-containing protein n=2 Tax=Zymoseptoria tritici TaxID=1047171 RepID=A0A1X7REZ4_ZYMT9|nr:unnamed protein product [Zymoseptoria tritici ST99CH_3D7]SMY19660.1 unnamed protein product [Zymoseptoria tritici ST99CH_1A5]
MPSSDYASAVGGGLKLKGSSSGIDKKKKKKKSSSKPSESKPTTNSETKADELEGETAEQESESQSALQKALADEEAQDTQLAKAAAEAELRGYGKTEAQRRHEERRKKRLDERLKKEGVLTHKERVQQLNKYLSTLSEHNDMPRIGPG